MQPKLTLLSDEIIARILEEAYELLLKPGVKVQNAEARELLAAAGAKVDPETHGRAESRIKSSTRRWKVCLTNSIYMITMAIQRCIMEATLSSLTQAHRVSRCSIPKHLNMTPLRPNT